MRVAGVDGVRERWVAAVLELDPAGQRPATVSWLLGSAADVLAVASADDVRAVGVDIPVGLVPTGRRSCEAEARRLLGPSASSVFATAPQPAFALAREHAPTLGNRPVADAAARAAGGEGLSTQSWLVAPKVLEVEDAVRALGTVADCVVEVHPESAFTAMADHFGVARPPSKRSAAGVAARVDLLGRTLPGLDVLRALAEAPAGPPARDRVPVDDALDAVAAACSALRHSYGRARVLGAADATRAVWSDGTPAPGRAVLVV